MQKIAIEREGKCISEKYINCDTKLLWECKEGHQWWALPKSIKYDDNWCPVCNESHGERKISIILTNNDILFEREKKFDDCRGMKRPLSYDFYLTGHNILIEYDGRQHHTPVNFHGCSNEQALKTHTELIENDKIKNEYCASNGISLIRIPHTVKNIEKYLLEKLKK